MIGLLGLLGIAGPPQDLEPADLVRLGAFDTVLERYEGALEAPRSEPLDGRVVAAVVRALEASGDLERARRLVAHPALLPGTEGPVGVERARLLLLQDRLEEAAAELLRRGPDGRAVPRFPGLAAAWVELARIRVRQLDFGAAERAASEALRLAPRGPGAAIAWQVRADALLHRGEGQRAGEALAKARELARWEELLRVRWAQHRRHPELPLPRLGLALLWMDAGELERARAILEELVRLHPEFARGREALDELRQRAAASR